MFGSTLKKDMPSFLQAAFVVCGSGLIAAGARGSIVDLRSADRAGVDSTPTWQYLALVGATIMVFLVCFYAPRIWFQRLRCHDEQAPGDGSPSAPSAAARGALDGHSLFDLALRYAVGVALGFAGLIKLYARPVTPLAYGDAIENGGTWSIVGDLELLLGAWLLTMGFRPAWVRGVIGVWFAALTCAAAYRVTSGEASCRCFGSMSVPPLYMLAFDVLALLGLATRPLWLARQRRPILALSAAGVCSCALGASAVIGARERPVAPHGTAPIARDAPRIVLKPRTWVGQQFGLARQVEGGARLLSGRWIVLLHRPDCPRCEAIKTQLAILLRDMLRPRLALIEVPGVNDERPRPDALGGRCARLRLDASRMWYVETPTAISLSHGVVEAVVDDGDGNLLRRLAEMVQIGKRRFD